MSTLDGRRASPWGGAEGARRAGAAGGTRGRDIEGREKEQRETHRRARGRRGGPQRLWGLNGGKMRTESGRESVRRRQARPAIARRGRVKKTVQRELVESLSRARLLLDQASTHPWRRRWCGRGGPWLLLEMSCLGSVRVEFVRSRAMGERGADLQSSSSSAPPGWPQPAPPCPSRPRPVYPPRHAHIHNYGLCYRNGTKQAGARASRGARSEADGRSRPRRVPVAVVAYRPPSSSNARCWR